MKRQTIDFLKDQKLEFCFLGENPFLANPMIHYSLLEKYADYLGKNNE